MKKSLVAVSVIVVLGAAWTGVSWYTGKLIEQHMDEQVAAANSQLQSAYPKAGLKVSYQDYQRGLFSSKMRIVLQPEPAAATAGTSLLKTGDEIAFIETIDHGPFPAAQLKKFNLIPSMASVHSELQNTPTVKGLFDVTKGKSLVTIDTRVSYSGASSSAADIIPVTYQKDESLLAFSGGKINVDVDKDLTAMKLDASTDSIALTSKNQWGQLEKVTLAGFSMDSDTKQGKFQVGVGDQNLTVKQILVNVDGKDAASLDNFKLVSKFSENGNNIGGQQDYTLDALKIQGADFGSAKLTVKLDKLDGAAMKQFADNYNQQSRALLMQQGQIDPAVYQQQAADLLLANLPLLLKGNPSISIAPLSWKNSKGESSFNLQLDLKDPTATPAQTQDQMLSQMVNKIDAKLTIPLPMATQVTTQVAQLEGYSADDAAKLAQQQVQGLAAMGQMFKLTTVKDDTLSSNFHYADNQVDLNGQKMTLQEFAGLFGILGGPAAPAPTPEQEAPVAPTPAPVPAQ
ncbi:YdgA family protein [Rahnella aquatilis]|uniref:YdgA family protein n=1 Tax=Rahnella aquatilis TaxID=34038 RepID=UPI000648642A|nr:YdgA family protein [Rahnella aquatilis]